MGLRRPGELAEGGHRWECADTDAQFSERDRGAYWGVNTSGLYHFRHRDYSPTLGRWTSLDAPSYAAGDVNLYRTLRNNPLNSLDPSGLDDDIPLPDAVAVPLPNPRLPVLSPPPPIPSWFDRLGDEVQMIGTFVVNSPGEAAWEYYTGLAYGAYGVFIEPVVNTGEAILDGGGFILIDDYEPLNHPHIQGMLHGERTWYGGTISLVMDGLGVVPVARGGQQVIRLGRNAGAGTNAFTVTIRKVGEWPTTGVARFDELAVECPAWQGWVTNLQKRGIKVMPNPNLPSGNPANYLPGSKILEYNPTTFRYIDLLHESRHIAQFERAAAKGLDLREPFRSSKLYAWLEKGALEYEMKLAKRFNFSQEYKSALENSFNNYWTSQYRYKYTKSKRFRSKINA